jgi:hypothetical protein
MNDADAVKRSVSYFTQREISFRRAGDCKASAGERVGQPLSPDRSWIPGADAFQIAEGNTDGYGRREVAQHDRWPRRSSGRSVGSDHSSRLRQIVDQGLRGFEVACVEPLREPFVDRREQLARFLASGVGLPQPGEARGSAKFQ